MRSRGFPSCIKNSLAFRIAYSLIKNSNPIFKFVEEDVCAKVRSIKRIGLEGKYLFAICFLGDCQGITSQIAADINKQVSPGFSYLLYNSGNPITLMNAVASDVVINSVPRPQ